MAENSTRLNLQVSVIEGTTAGNASVGEPFDSGIHYLASQLPSPFSFSAPVSRSRLIASSPIAARIERIAFRIAYECGTCILHEVPAIHGRAH
jgi:hypothetical protein